MGRFAQKQVPYKTVSTKNIFRTGHFLSRLFAHFSKVDLNVFLVKIIKLYGMFIHFNYKLIVDVINTLITSHNIVIFFYFSKNTGRFTQRTVRAISIFCRKNIENMNNAGTNKII